MDNLYFNDGQEVQPDDTFEPPPPPPQQEWIWDDEAHHLALGLSVDNLGVQNQVNYEMQFDRRFQQHHLLDFPSVMPAVHHTNVPSGFYRAGPSSDNLHSSHSYAVNPHLLASMQHDHDHASPNDQDSPPTVSAPTPEPPNVTASIFTPAAPTHPQLLGQRPLPSQRELVPDLSAKLSAPSQAGPSSGGGPTSRAHAIPPRPKPGRKPATDEPENKRKAQNRLSQRNFRQRKTEATAAMQAKLTEQEESHRAEKNDLLRSNQELRVENQQLRAQIHQLLMEKQTLLARDHRFNLVQQTERPGNGAYSTAAALSGSIIPWHQDNRLDSPPPSASSETNQVDCGSCQPDNCACMREFTDDNVFQKTDPAEDDTSPMTGILRGDHDESNEEDKFAELETDFTAKFRSSNTVKVHDCGWCDGRKELCLCNDDSLRPDETVPLSRAHTDSSAEDVKPNVAMTGPGSCEACQANPKQREWCQRVAQGQSEATPPSSPRDSTERASSNSSSFDVMEPKAATTIDMTQVNNSCARPERTLGCNEAFRLLDGRVSTDPNAMDWRRLKPVPPTFSKQDSRSDSFTMEPGKFSAMELDASSILTTLQHAPGPLRPRPSDGDHARLVQEAEERRRKAFSPKFAAAERNVGNLLSEYDLR